MKVRSLLPLLPLVAGFHANGASAQVTDVVCLETTYGDICIRLLGDDAPKHVANFLQYVNDGDYNNSFFHRSVKGFVLQGGGYSFTNGTIQMVPRDATVTNEFKLSNVRGTVALAKSDLGPDSGTSEWFINLGDNTNTLGSANNGGFTVFGEVVLNGMEVVDCIAAVPAYNGEPASGDDTPFRQLPLIDLIPTLALKENNFLMIKQAYVTRRDLSDPNAQSSCVKPVPLALAKLESGLFTAPVRVGSKIYKLIFRQSGTPPEYIFTAETFSIVEQKDIGQETAVFAGDTLTLPSISIGEAVFTDLIFIRTNPETLEFTLQSYNRKN